MLLFACLPRGGGALPWRPAGGERAVEQINLPASCCNWRAFAQHGHAFTAPAPCRPGPHNTHYTSHTPSKRTAPDASLHRGTLVLPSSAHNVMRYGEGIARRQMRGCTAETPAPPAPDPGPQLHPHDSRCWLHRGCAGPPPLPAAPRRPRPSRPSTGVPRGAGTASSPPPTCCPRLCRTTEHRSASSLAVPT